MKKTLWIIILLFSIPVFVIATDVVNNTKVGVSNVRLNGDITVTIEREKDRDGELVEITYYHLPVAWTLPDGAKPKSYRIYYNSTYYVDVEDGTLRSFVIPAKNITNWSMASMSVVTLPFVIRVIAIYDTGEMEPANVLTLNTEEILKIPPISSFSSISVAKTTAQKEPYDAILRANDLLVTYVNGKYVYVFDGVDGLLLFANNASLNEGIKIGDRITADVIGQIKLYNGLTELAVSEYANLTVNSSNNTVTPQTATIADISNNFSDYENELVTIAELTPVTEGWANRNITFTDDSDNELVVRDNWNVGSALTFDTSKTYGVTGFVAIYATETASIVQLYPRSADDFNGDTSTFVYPDPRETALDNPYSVAELRALNATSVTEPLQEGAFVVGYIVGYINGSTLSETTAIFSAEAPAVATRAEDPNVSASNFLLADNPSCKDIAAVVPINLAPNNPARTDLNLKDNPGRLGTKVWLLGNVRKYMGVTGLHSVKYYSPNGVDFFTVFFTLTYLIDGITYNSYQIPYGSAIESEMPQKEGYTFSGWDNLPATMPSHDVTVNGSFIINQYSVTYMIDGNVYETQTVEYGSAINTPEPPALTGYTFMWNNVPAKMPAMDITIEGSYIPNVYKITYWVDDVGYKVVDIPYGTNIVAETNPEKEGYTFSGWSEIPATMPAHDVTVIGSFTINTYKVIYEVNGEEYKSYEVEFGSTVPIADALEREGYTFSGWSMIPATMPAHDIVITASFTKGAYKLIYIVDGVVYKILSYDFQDGITAEDAPEKEGYTFSGWNEIPETMPANDVAVTGTFTINHYTLTLMVGDNVYETRTLDYGSAIVVPEMPELTGYTFTWGEVPATMPAQDVTIVGEYQPNLYNATYLINGQFFAIFKVPYGSTITTPDAPEREGSTFTWGEYPETMPAHDITIEGTYTDGINLVQGNQHVEIYTVDGKKVNRMQRGVNIINGKKVIIR